MNVFHTCYYINLDRSKDRKKHMEETFSNLKRIEGIDGNDLIIEKKILNKIKVNKFEIACFQSHLKAVRTAYNNGDEEALIMEDDIHIDFIDKWEKNIMQIIKDKPKDTECLQFHCSNLKEVKKMLKINKNYSLWNKKRWSTGCYYITRKGMSKMIKLEPNYIPKIAIDHFIYKKIKTYNYTRPIFNLIENNKSLILEGNIRKTKIELYRKYFANIDLLKRIRRNISFLQNKINDNMKIFKRTKHIRKKHQIKIKLVKLMRRFIVNNKRFDRIIS